MANQKKLNNSKDVLLVYVDGACNNVKGLNQMGIGVSVQYDGVELLDYSSYEGLGTNNEAEFVALRTGLIESNLLALDLKREGFKVKRILIHSDSQIIVNIYNREWQCRQKSLIPFLNKCWQVIPSFPTELVWIPREQNKRADELSKREITRLGYRKDKSNERGNSQRQKEQAIQTPRQK